MVEIVEELGRRCARGEGARSFPRPKFRSQEDLDGLNTKILLAQGVNLRYKSPL